MEATMTKTGYETGLNDYVKRERAAVDLINSVGSLMYDKGVELVLFRNHIVNVTISNSNPSNVYLAYSTYWNGFQITI